MAQVVKTLNLAPTTSNIEGDIILAIKRNDGSGTGRLRPSGDNVWVCDNPHCGSVCFKVGGAAEGAFCTFENGRTSTWRPL